MYIFSSGQKKGWENTHLVHAGPDEDYLLSAIPDTRLKVCKDYAALAASCIRPLLIRHCSPPVALLTDLKVLTWICSAINSVGWKTASSELV
jgi:hypothetical protein